jgi:glycosyltransferase involved in cell wall biosynthesis
VTTLALEEAVPLAHALVNRAARDHDVRILFIKGPIAVAQGLRAERRSVDVDALVDPARRSLLAAALPPMGWADENPYTSPTVLPMHSLTFRHPRWPCELDLHDRFPGFFADPQAAFEALWSRRTTARVAGQDVPAPDRAGHALILALHSLRDPHEAWRQADLHDLEQRLAADVGAEELRDLATLARTLGAADTAAPFLRAVGAPALGLGSTSATDLRAWRLRTAPSDTTAVSWVAELRHLPLRAWPRYLWYAAWLSEHELRMAEPSLAPGRRAVWEARLRRLRRGLAALPAAARSVRQPEDAAPAEDEIVVATLLRPEGETGVQTHMQALVAHLRTGGRVATVVSPFSARSPFVRPLFAVRLPLRWVNRSWSIRWYRHWHAHYLRHALRRHLRTAARGRVVYAQCPVSADVALEVRGAEPVVMVAHFNISQADEWADRGEISREGRYFRSIRSFEASVLPRLDGVVYVSAWARERLLDRVPALRDVPSATVPNFVEVRACDGDRPPPSRDLISVGTLEPRKNQGYLLEVLAAANRRGHRFTLSIVGDGGSRVEWERESRSRGLAGQVGFIGFHHAPRSLMAEHRLYCHTALMENLPLALIEAMAEGLPVVAGAVGGIPSMFQDGVEGAFWPLDDPDAAALVLIDLLGHPDRLRAMGDAARRRVAEEYAAHVVVPRLESFLAGARHPRTTVP